MAFHIFQTVVLPLGGQQHSYIYSGSTQLFTQCVVPPYKTHTTNFILSACCLYILACLSCCTAHELKGWKVWCMSVCRAYPPNSPLYQLHSSTDHECKSMVHCNKSCFPELLYTPPQGNTKSTLQLVLSYLNTSCNCLTWEYPTQGNTKSTIPQLVLSWSNSTPIGSHWSHWPQVVVHYV